MSDCTCVPCASPAYGAPGIAHCAACCYGSMVEDYDPDCPHPKHQEMAERQHPKRLVVGPLEEDWYEERLSEWEEEVT